MSVFEALMFSVVVLLFVWWIVASKMMFDTQRDLRDLKTELFVYEHHRDDLKIRVECLEDNFETLRESQRELGFEMEQVIMKEETK